MARIHQVAGGSAHLRTLRIQALSGAVRQVRGSSRRLNAQRAASRTVRYPGVSQLSNTTPVQIASARSLGSRKWRILQTTRMRPVVLCFFVLLLSMPVHATIAHAADGREIAANGNGRDAPACSACHGAQGAGQPDVAYPRLAGLDSAYLIEQLNAFAEGTRDNETMPPIAKALTPDERQASREILRWISGAQNGGTTKG